MLLFFLTKDRLCDKITAIEAGLNDGYEIVVSYFIAMPFGAGVIFVFRFLVSLLDPRLQAVILS